MKGILQTVLVTLVALSISPEIQANRPTEIPEALPMPDYSEFIIQKSHIIEDGNSNVRSSVIAPEKERNAGRNNQPEFSRQAAIDGVNNVDLTFLGDIIPANVTVRFYKADDFYLTGNIIDSEMWKDEHNVSYTVPSGDYDVYVFWVELEQNASHIRNCLVVRQNVTIDSNTQLQFSRDDAPNQVGFCYTLPNGETPKWPHLVMDDYGNIVKDLSDANVGMTHVITHLFDPVYGFDIASYSAFNYVSDGSVDMAFDENANRTVWCSELPSSMWISQHIIMNNERGELYSSMASTKVQSAENIVHVGNEGYHKIAEEFEYTPYMFGENGGSDIYSHGYNIQTEVCGFPSALIQMYVTNGSKLDVYVQTKPMLWEGKNVTLNYITQTSYESAKEIMHMYRFSGIKSPEIVNIDGNGYYLNGAWDDFSNHFTFRAPEGGYYKWQGVLPRTNIHPVFSYQTNLRKQKLGNNAPIMAVLTLNYGTPETTIPAAAPAIKGRYGESRLIDRETLQASVTIGEDNVFEGLWSEYMQYMYNDYLNGPDGNVKVIFTDENVSVDGIAGKNVTEFGYDKKGSDVWAPTLQMLHFKDAEGYVNDRFVNASDGTIEFAGGDFIEHFNDDDYYWYTEEEAEVNVEYAPYGTDDYMALEVDEVPELYFMPGYGHFYRGSLGNVDRKSSNGWFDIRISMKDAVGNYQTQTISPAFKVESLSGVETVNVDSYTVKVNGRNIIAPDGSKIFTVQGTITDGKNVMPGIYLVKTAANTSKVIVK